MAMARTGLGYWRISVHSEVSASGSWCCSTNPSQAQRFPVGFCFESWHAGNSEMTEKLVGGFVNRIKALVIEAEGVVTQD